jgi:hypothetical protein
MGRICERSLAVADASLLGRTIWDQERARDICREYVIERLGEASGVLVVYETGFLKKGTHSVGVARQYSGTAGWLARQRGMRRGHFDRRLIAGNVSFERH